MRTYKFVIKLFDGGEAYAKVRAINAAQAGVLASQFFPDWLSVDTIAKLPRNQEWSLEL